MTKQPQKPRLRPRKQGIEVAVFAAADLVEEIEALRKKAEIVMATLQTIRREADEQ